MRKDAEVGLIAIPDTASPSGNAVVAAVGPGEISSAGTLIKPRVKVGDRVVIGDRAVLGSVPGHTDCALVRERDIVCILRDTVH